MNERNLKLENQRLRREVAQLRKDLEEIRREKYKYQDPTPAAVTPTAAPTAQKPYDPSQPVKPGTDPVWDALRAQHPHQRKRRSWLDVT